MSEIRKRLLRKFGDKEYREAYLEAFLDSVVSTQIRDLRERENWSQKELADRIGTKQSVISRIEGREYSRWSIETLKRLARAFDLALCVKFISFGDALNEIDGFQTDHQIRPSFSDDPVFVGDSFANIHSSTQKVIPFVAAAPAEASPMTDIGTYDAPLAVQRG